MVVEWACIGCNEIVDPAKKKCYAINEDIVIKTIRRIKTSINNFMRIFIKDFNIVKGYSLCVCEDHLKEFKDKRNKFEKTLALNAIIAVLVFVVLTALPVLLTFNINIIGFFGSLFLAILIFLFSFIYYAPNISNEPIQKKAEKGKTKRMNKYGRGRKHKG